MHNINYNKNINVKNIIKINKKNKKNNKKNKIKKNIIGNLFKHLTLQSTFDLEREF